MTARQRVLLHLSELADEDVDALLPIVERLRAKRLVPAHSDADRPRDSAESHVEHQHRERFGALAGTVKIVSDSDIESPVEPGDGWTYDEGNIAS